MRQVVVSISYNTKELTALLLWSLHRILEPADRSILIVDNASTDGSIDMLTRAEDAGLCQLITNLTNIGHGLALNRAFDEVTTKEADRVWILDSDCVVAPPDALRAALSDFPEAAVIGETHWDQWHNKVRHELHSLVVDPSALDRSDVARFTEGGDPSWELLASAERGGLRLAAFPFTAEGYVIHLGRGSLAGVAASGDENHPLYSWAIEHNEPHFGEVAGADARYASLLEQFRHEVGPTLDLASALRP